MATIKSEDVVKQEDFVIKKEEVAEAGGSNEILQHAAAAASHLSAQAKLYTGPFPNCNRPSAEECHAARDALAALHGEPRRGQLGEDKTSKRDESACGVQTTSVLDSLVRTILSQNTTDITSHRAFSSLKAALPTWEEVRCAPNTVIESAIRVGGLAEIKTKRIKAILDTLHSERGACCLEHLRTWPEDDIKVELLRFKGVGHKTIACVLMFCLQRDEFPVDTHVWEIAKRLGWVPPGATRDQAYQHLNCRVPDKIKYDLHVLLVEHGKRCGACAKAGSPRQRTSDVKCPLNALRQAARGGSRAAKAEANTCITPKPEIKSDHNGSSIEHGRSDGTAGDHVRKRLLPESPRRVGTWLRGMIKDLQAT